MTDYYAVDEHGQIRERHETHRDALNATQQNDLRVLSEHGYEDMYGDN